MAKRVVVSMEEKETGTVIRLRRAGGEEIEVVTNGHVEQVTGLEPVAAPHWKDRFWWEAEDHRAGEPEQEGLTA
jgi:hypothetical protein